MRSRLLVAVVSVIVLGVFVHTWLAHKPLASGLSSLGQSTAAGAHRPLENHRPLPAPASVTPTPPVETRVSQQKSPRPSGTLSLLVVGLDRRPGHRYGGRPDTLIVAVFEDERVGLVSIPRDLYVEVPGWGLDRINASFAAAERAKQPPLEVLERVVEDTLKMPIEHTLAIDLGGFETAVDALGGIDVQVRCPIIDNFVDSRSPGGRRRLNVMAGTQTMDGVTAAMYVRSRHGRSDWSRARRQQAVLFAIKERATSLGGLSRLPTLFNQLESLLITDMTRSDLLKVARFGLSIEPGRIHGLVLGHTHTEAHRTADGKAVLLPKHDAIQAALDDLFVASAPGTLPSNARCAPADAAMRYRSATGKAGATEPAG